MFDKAIGLKNKVGPIDLFVPEAYWKTQTSNLTLKTEKQTQTCTKPSKRPRSAWIHYSLLNRPRCKAQNPNRDWCNITKILNSEWKKMNQIDRLVYVKMANKDKEKYNYEIQEFETMADPVPTKKMRKNSDYKLKEEVEKEVEEEVGEEVDVEVEVVVEVEVDEEEMEEESQCDSKENDSDSKTGMIEESTVRMDTKAKRPRARRAYGREEA